MRLSNTMINTAIDLSELGLDTIVENAEEFSIGAMVSLRDIEVHEGLNQYTNNAVKKWVWRMMCLERDFAVIIRCLIVCSI